MMQNKAKRSSTARVLCDGSSKTACVGHAGLEAERFRNTATVLRTWTSATGRRCPEPVRICVFACLFSASVVACWAFSDWPFLLFLVDSSWCLFCLFPLRFFALSPLRFFDLSPLPFLFSDQAFFALLSLFLPF